MGDAKVFCVFDFHLSKIGSIPIGSGMWLVGDGDVDVDDIQVWGGQRHFVYTSSWETRAFGGIHLSTLCLSSVASFFALTYV